MFKQLQRWRDGRHVRAHPVPDALWDRTLLLPALRHLNDADCMKLRALVPLFLRDKAFFGAHEFVVTEWMKTRIATEACLPVLHIATLYPGLATLYPGFATLYPGFATVVLYETAFVAEREQVDDIGVVHVGKEEMTGESWEQGPVILSWQDIQECDTDNSNLVLHEFAHKLDCLSGDMNGCPPLPATMSYRLWRDAFTDAYDGACADVHAGRDPGIDPYATEAPAEFFAVAMEAFFMTPHMLRARYAPVYARLCEWLQQDPAAAAPIAHAPMDDRPKSPPRPAQSTTRALHGTRRRPGSQW